MTDTILSEMTWRPHDGEIVHHDIIDNGNGSAKNLDLTADDLLAVFTGGVLVVPTRGADCVRLRLPGRHEVAVL